MRAFGGRFRPLLELGRGGMSRVFLCIADSQLGASKLVVVKTLLPEFASDPEFLTMFVEEARLSARLNHPNVIQLNEVCADGGEYFLVMEFLDGQSLEAIVRRTRSTGAFPVELYLHAIVEAAKGLDYAHDLVDENERPLHLVHRDVSPHNVFVTYQGEVKVLDFGIAKAADTSQQTRTGVLKGKFAYMAPEQIKDPKGIDRRVDVFALGVMLWQAATRRRLWSGLGDVEIFQRLAAGALPSPLEYAPGLSRELVGIIQRAMAHAREDRYPTAGALADDLEIYLEGQRARVGPRPLGELVSQLFAERRAKVKDAVDVALATPPVSSGEVHLLSEVGGSSMESMNLRQTGSRLDRPSLGPAALRHTGTHPSVASPVARTHGSVPPPGAAHGSGRHSAAGFTGPGSGRMATDPGPGSRRSHVGSHPSGVESLGGIGLTDPGSGRRVVAAPADARRRTTVLASIIVLALGVVGGTLLVARAPARPPAALPLPPPPPPTSTTVAVEPAFVELTLVAVPAEAKFFLDNTPLPGNPAKARFGRDTKKHEIRAEAPGYQTSSQVVQFDEPVKSLSFALAREAKR